MADYDEDKKELLDTGSTKNAGTYSSSSSVSNDGDQRDAYEGNKALNYIYVHRAHIPGYGTWRLLKNAKPYALYVLFALLVAYLLNQLDRYTLPVVTSTVGADLHYGDKSCGANPDIDSSWLNASNTSMTECHYFNNTPCDNLTDLCAVDDLNTKFRGLDIK